MSRVVLRNLPNSHPIQSISFPNLNGGLNIHDLDYLLPPNQSALIKNLWWKDGALQSRDGQECKLAAPAPGVEGYACVHRLFHGYAFMHIGTHIYYCDPTASAMQYKQLTPTIQTVRGTFFFFNEFLMYKTKGSYIRISYTPEAEDPFSAVDLLAVDWDDPTSVDTAKIHVPVIVINANPSNGSGDMYQPENRLCPVKEVWYTVPDTAPEDYYLPVKDEAQEPTLSIVSVTVTNAAQTPAYEFTAATGCIHFTANAPAYEQYATNTVRVRYFKPNDAAFTAISDCRYAHVFKGASDLCILMAGSEAQPNAIFWNSNSELAMDPTYFPVSYYNLCGDAVDPVRGFGTQYSDYLVFKERQIGKLAYTTVDLEGRASISFTYTIINDVYGCDLPWTIQTVENNLVFCNTYAGVHLIQAASPAYENNVVLISKNVNGTDDRPGLLKMVENATDRDHVVAHDDGVHYWLTSADTGEAFVWNYEISTPSSPSWFYFTNIMARDFFSVELDIYHVDPTGQMYKFERTWRDTVAPPVEGTEQESIAIDKTYAFPPQYFGTYDRVKDIMYVLFSIRADVDQDIIVTYFTDYAENKDKTNVVNRRWSLAPRNLAYRLLAPGFFAAAAKRIPPCRHIQHFSMRLENNQVGQDLALLSAQIFYRFTGRMR